MELGSDYKRTEIGTVPEDWDVNRLDALGAGSVPPIKAGPFGSSLTKDTYVPSGYKIYGQEQVIRGDHLYGDYYISPRKYQDLQSCAVRPGDILLSLVGTTGKLLVVPDGAPQGIINPRLLRLSFDKKRVCPRFFKYLFESNGIQNFLTQSAQGGTMGVLNAGMLRPLTVALPSLAEQNSIADTLTEVDKLVAKLNKLATKKRDLKQATTQQLLTGLIRLPGFRDDWKTERLGNIANIKTGSRNNEDKVQDGLHPFFVRSEVIERINSYSHDCEAILVPGEGRIGNIFHYIRGKFDVHQRVYAITQFRSHISGRFIHFYLSNYFGAWAMQNTVKATVDSLRLPTFQTFEVRLPPTLEEQMAIAAVLSDMDAEIAALEARRDKTRLLKQGMMQELLTGRIRLV